MAQYSELIPGFDYTVKLSRAWPNTNRMAVDINRWCEQTFGPGVTNFTNTIVFPAPEVRWCARVWFGYFEYMFRSEADATLFRLRWD